VLVAVRYGLSRRSVHEWMGPYQAEGLPGLTDRVPDREGPLATVAAGGGIDQGVALIA
jgi:hypothetical protein